MARQRPEDLKMLKDLLHRIGPAAAGPLSGRVAPQRAWRLRGGRLSRAGGAVVSHAAAAGGTRLTASVSALALGALGLMSAEARAACTEVSSNTAEKEYTCTGALTSSQSLTSDGAGLLKVTLDASASLLATGDENGFDLTSEQGISFTQSASGQQIAAKRHAIHALNQMIGASGGQSGTAVAVTVTGTVKGGYLSTANPQHAGDFDGIRAINALSSGTDVTVSAAAVSGARSGIRAITLGTGTASVTASGSVSGVSGPGIYANAQGSITVTAAAVTGAIGIFAKSSGTGAVELRATGMVAGTASQGILATSRAASLTLTAASVSGGGAGIDATTSGAGAIRISASGAVEGASGSGVAARAFGDGAISISTSGSVAGSSYGIKATGYGTGSVSINASGDVTGPDNAVQAEASGMIDVVTSGTVSASSAGSAGIRADGKAAESVTVTASGRTSGARYGIYASSDGGGNVSVDAAGSVEGSYIGVFASASGTVDVQVGGAVTGTHANYGIGVFAQATGARDLVIETSGTVRGGLYGIFATASGAGGVEISAGGRVEGTGDAGVGLFASGSGGGSISLSVSGTVAGPRAAIVTQSIAGQAVTVTLGSGARVFADAARAFSDASGNASVTVESGASIRGSVSGGGGTDRLAFRAGAAGSVTLSGVEMLAVDSGASVTLAAPPSGLEDATVGGTLALRDGATSSVTLSGDFGGGGRVVFEADFGQPKADTLVVAGTLGEMQVEVSEIGRGAREEYQHGRVSIIEVASGTQIADDALSVGPDYRLEVADSGTGKTVYLIRNPQMRDNACTALNYGILACRGALDATQSLDVRGSTTIDMDLQASATFDVSEGGAIVLTQSGAGGVDLDQEAGGQAISGAASGILARSMGGGAVSIRVTGSVTGRGGGDGDAGIHATGDASGAALTITAASVQGGGHGIWASSTGGAVAVSASGPVAGAAGHGIYARSAAAAALTVTAGAVSGGRSGIRAMAGGDAAITASGAVAGGSGADEAAIRIDSRSGAAVAVTLESGASAGAAGRNAILDGDADATVTVKTGASIAGAVSLGRGTDALVFAGGAMEGASLSAGGGGRDTLTFANGARGAATAVEGWETIAVQSGASVRFSGRVATDSMTIRGTASLADGRRNAVVVGGDFIGGGTVAIDVDLAGGRADSINVQGDVRGGQTTLELVGVGEGPPAGGGIVVARVDGGLDADGGAQAFVAGSGAVASGAFSYAVELGESGNGEFVLRTASRSVGEVGALMQAAPAALLAGFARMPSAAQRAAARTRPAAGQGPNLEALFGPGFVEDGPGGLWVRVHAHSEERGEGPDGGTAEISASGLEAGADLAAVETGAGEWTLGLFGRYGAATLDAAASGRVAAMEATGFGVGAAALWRGDGGAYADVQSAFSWITADFSSAAAGAFASGSEATAAAASVELGWRIDGAGLFGEGLGAAIVPQARVSWAGVSADGVDLGAAGAGRAEFGADSSTIVRMGAAAEFALGAAEVRLSGSLARDVASAPDVEIGGAALQGRDPGIWTEIGFGGSMGFGEGGVIGLEGGFRSSSGDSSGAGLSGQVRWRW